MNFKRTAGTVAAALVIAAPLAMTSGGPISPVVAGSSTWATGGMAGDAITSIPFESLTDWATYGDYLVVMFASGESRGELPAEQRERGEGFAPRFVILDKSVTVWKRDGAPSTVPASLKVAAGGWVVHGDEEQGMSVPGTEFLTVGRQYLVLLAFGDPAAGVDRESRSYHPSPEGKRWGVVDALPIVDGVVTIPEVGDRRQSSAREKLSGMSIEAVSALMADTQPDPAAEPYMDLPPAARYQNTRYDAAGR